MWGGDFKARGVAWFQGGNVFTKGVMHTWTQRWWQHAHRRHKPDRIWAHRRGSGHKAPPLANKLFTVDSHQKREKSIFFNGATLGMPTRLHGRPCAQEWLANPTRTAWFLSAFYFVLFWFCFKRDYPCVCFPSSPWNTCLEFRAPPHQKLCSFSFDPAGTLMVF